jgi:hypothetical protein
MLAVTPYPTSYYYFVLVYCYEDGRTTSASSEVARQAIFIGPHPKSQPTMGQTASTPAAAAATAQRPIDHSKPAVPARCPVDHASASTPAPATPDAPAKCPR